MEKITFEDIQNYKSNCVNAKETGQKLKTLGNEECEELIRICKAFDCEVYELTHEGSDGIEWLVTCQKITNTRIRRQIENIKKAWEISPWQTLRYLFDFKLKSYKESIVAKENEKLKQEIEELKQILAETLENDT